MCNITLQNSGLDSMISGDSFQSLQFCNSVIKKDHLSTSIPYEEIWNSGSV